jgi:Putative beta barrel porin-7 (BBP7)
MRMIRRKIWATATCCLAIAAAAKAQTGAPKATLGAPQPDSPGYVARGAAPNPGYPTFVPRNYVAPTPPTYAAPPAPGLLPASADPKPPMAPPPANFADSPAAKLVPTDVKPPATLGPVASVVENSAFAVDTVPPTPPATATPAVTSPIFGAPMGCGPTGCAPYLDETCGAMPTCWFSAEYLKWQLKGVKPVPLVTTAPAGAPGTLDDSRTTVLYGGGDILKEWKTGCRFRAGIWFEGGTSGLDVAYFTLGHIQEAFGVGSNGNPGLFRPFFNTALNTEDAQLVAFIDPVTGPVLSGRVGVFSESELQGAELNYRSGWTTGMGGRVDMLCGYRYLRLRDTIDIESSLTTLSAAGAAPAGTRIFSFDRFEALNQFHGLQVGAVGEWQFGQMTFGLRGTVAAGATIQRVEISGGSGSVTPTGVVVAAPGGLYALTTNIGTHDKTRFAIASEIGATVGYQVTENIRVFAGYNFLCWTNVVRAGEQIDRFVNPTFIPDPTTGIATPTGRGFPRYHPVDETFYAHGCTLGVEFRW